MSGRRARTPWRPLGAPLLVAALTLGGLVLGLTGSGWRDALCAAATGLPLVLFLLHWRRRRRAVPVRKTR
ncbi:hypothetical protein [Novosphingobium huizhouense]|uniref:hypothetical protein n=1 Tax=Novosphingobium huizhouense TaxID=2866625 RepID=UPI001CD88079|nr:hypothetical protein [Novosphingobium huizhouense]